MDARAHEYPFEVVSIEPVAKDVWRLVAKTAVADKIGAGEFVNIHVPGDGAHILRIPLSFSRADANTHEIEFVFAVVGEGTRRLSSMRPTEGSTLVGPLGRGWSAPVKEGRALLVAGGMGLAPIVACARLLEGRGQGFDVVVGAQTAERHVNALLEDLKELGHADPAFKLILTTDDGSLGMRGFATAAMQDLLAEHGYARCYTCGPQPMMAGVARIAAARSLDCEASLERLMGCGFGACSCCNVELSRGGYALCCTDGPVFDASEVAW